MSPGTTAGVSAQAWMDAVRANRVQVDRVREVPDGADFYAPVRSMFRADPHRSGDAVLDALVSLAVPGETWLDIGAGAGRYALPLALAVREVIALDPSDGMLSGLREGMAESGIANVRVVRDRWPPAGPGVEADVSLIAHVGYDTEDIGSFLDAMEAATRRLCVAVMMDRAPAALAADFWPAVHGEARHPLPALPELLAVLAERSREVTQRVVQSERRVWSTREELLNLLRRQTWVIPDGARDRRLQALLDQRLETVPTGVMLRGEAPLSIGVATWTPR